MKPVELPFDLARARAETPGCRNGLHFESAGASLMPQCVLDAQIDHLRLEGEVGGYAAADQAADKIARTYGAVAELLNAKHDEIALVENATVGWNLALHGLDLGPGDKILTAEAEYSSNYIAYLQLAQRRGIRVEAVPSRPSGELDVAALEAMLTSEVKLVSITHVPTNGGLVNPAADIGRVTRAAGVPYLLDACQSAGQIELDVEVLGCDLLTASGRKFLRGPRGSGFLYVRRSILDRLTPPVLDNRSARWVASDHYEIIADARRFENWEFNYAAVIGLGVAIDYALDWGIGAIEARVTALAALLRAKLTALPGVRVRDIGSRQCAIVTFDLEKLSAEAVNAALAARGFKVTTTTPFSTRLDAERRGLGDMIRAAVHYYNSEAEIDALVAAVAEISG